MKSAMHNLSKVVLLDLPNDYNSVMNYLNDITNWELVSFTALTTIATILSVVYLMMDGKMPLNFWKSHHIDKFQFKQTPGPWGFPILGHLPRLGSMPHLRLTSWSKQYGNVFQIRLGLHKAIVVNGSKTIRDTLIHKGVDFAGRPGFPSFRMVNNGQGMIFNSYSASWQTKRTLMQKAVGKYFLNGSQFMNNALKEHADAMIEELMNSSSGGRAIDPSMPMLRHSSRLFYNVLISDSEVDKESRHQQIEKLINLFSKILKLSSYTALTDIFPPLQVFFPKQLKEFKEINDIIANSLKQDQLNSLKNYNSEITRDITDSLVLAKQSIREEDLKNADLLDSNGNSKTLALLGDLLGAGQSTVATSLKWLMLHMATFPNVQQKIRDEIESNFSNESDLLDLKIVQEKFPYTIATVLESQRFSVLFPMLVPHSAIKDTEINGHKVEKDTIVIFNIWSASRDLQEWNEPEKFQPERFLTEDGLHLNQTNKHNFPVFGLGRRRCIGEQLGRKAVYYFFLRIMSSCRVSLPSDTKTPPNLLGVFGFSLDPEPYQVSIESTTELQ